MSAWKLTYRSLIVLCILGLFFIPLPDNNLWWRQAANSGHVIVFLLLSFALYSYVGHSPRNQTRLISYVVVIAVGMLIGAAIEVVQYFTGRDAGVIDMVTNFSGLLAGLGLIEVIRKSEKQSRASVRLVLFASSIILILISVLPLLLLSVSYIERNEAFPVIADFDAHWKSTFIKFNQSRLH